MNIFVLDLDPFLCAQYHCDKHVCKMIIESAQILSTVHHLTKSTLLGNPDIQIYKPTHKNHPCTIWARNCLENYIWLTRLALGLCREYSFRYNKIHKTEFLIHNLFVNLPSLPLDPITPFAQAMPIIYRKENDPVTAYRNYYIGEKKHFAKYTKRGVPSWLK